MSQEFWTTIVVGIIALLGGASATAIINVVARRRVTGAEADSLVVDAADKLMHRQQEQLDRGDKERVKMEAEIQALRLEVGQLREDLRAERIKCDADLAQLRGEIVELALRINPNQGDN